MAQLENAKVFMSGRSHAVRIPASYRFTSKEVYIRRDPKNGDLILSPAPGSLREIFEAFTDIPRTSLSPCRGGVKNFVGGLEGNDRSGVSL